MFCYRVYRNVLKPCRVCRLPSSIGRRWVKTSPQNERLVVRHLLLRFLLLLWRTQKEALTGSVLLSTQSLFLSADIRKKPLRENSGFQSWKSHPRENQKNKSKKIASAVLLGVYTLHRPVEKWQLHPLIIHDICQNSPS